MGQWAFIQIHKLLVLVPLSKNVRNSGSLVLVLHLIQFLLTSIHLWSLLMPPLGG